VKKFYSIKLKEHRENIPARLAEQMLLDVEHHQRFAQLFLGKFAGKLK
jgi:hypothetical protein